MGYLRSREGLHRSILDGGKGKESVFCSQNNMIEVGCKEKRFVEFSLSETKVLYSMALTLVKVTLAGSHQ